MIQDFEKAYRTGFDYLRQKRFWDAENCLLSALRFRTEATTLLALADVCVNTGRPNMAGRFCERLLQLDRGHLLEPQEERVVPQAHQIISGLQNQGTELTRIFLKHPAKSEIDIDALRGGAKAGDAMVQFDLGIRYAYGFGVPQDYSNATYCFRLAADRGIPQAENNLGVCHENSLSVGIDLRQATELYTRAARKDYPEAQFNLGYCYLHGIGLPQDPSQGIEWVQIASNKGHAEAQNILGCLYGRGKGVKHDDSEALKWFRQSASSGYFGAYLNIALFCVDGRGMAQPDWEEAGRWFHVAIDEGVPETINLLESLDSRIAGDRRQREELGTRLSWFGRLGQQDMNRLQREFQAIFLNSRFASVHRGRASSSVNGSGCPVLKRPSVASFQL